MVGWDRTYGAYSYKKFQSKAVTIFGDAKAGIISEGRLHVGVPLEVLPVKVGRRSSQEIPLQRSFVSDTFPVTPEI